MQDIRKMLQDDAAKEQLKMPAGHQAIFKKRLKKELPKTQQNSHWFLKIAASVVIAVGIGIITFKMVSTPNQTTVATTSEEPKKTSEQPRMITLGDLSPDLKKVETYYVANINLELSELNVTPQNKQLLDGYLARLGVLNTEYESLTKELNTIGPNEKTVSALISNLQLRLQLLQKLKEKLNELKLENNETFKNEQL